MTSAVMYVQCADKSPPNEQNALEKKYCEVITV
jgi:hypothetical protein